MKIKIDSNRKATKTLTRTQMGNIGIVSVITLSETLKRQNQFSLIHYLTRKISTNGRLKGTNNNGMLLMEDIYVLLTIYIQIT